MWAISFGAGGCAAVACLVFALWTLVIVPLRLAAFYRAQGLRGTPWTFLVGDLPLFFRMRQSAPEPFIDISRHFAGAFGPIAFNWFGPAFRLRISDAPLLREILVTHSYKFHKSPLAVRLVGPFLGLHNLLLSEGDEHRRHRRIASGAFRFDALQALVPLMSESAARQVGAWLTTGVPAPRVGDAAVEGDGSWVELEVGKQISALTLDIVGRAAFGVGSDSEGGDGRGLSVFAQSSSLLDAITTSAMSVTNFIPGWRSLPLPVHQRMDRQVWDSVRVKA